MPDIDAANLNNMEAGITAAPYGPDASNNQLPVWNGSAWVYEQISDAQVSASAAIAYSKLNLAAQIKNADIATAAAIVRSKLDFGSGLVNADIAAAAAIAYSKMANPGGTTTFLRADGTFAVAAPTTYHLPTTVTVNNSVAETNLFSQAIAANIQGANGVLRITAGGDFLGNNGTINPPRWKLKLGATTLIDTGTAGITQNSATRFPWTLRAEIINLGATNSQLVLFWLKLAAGTFNQQGFGAFTTGEGIYESVNAGALPNTGSFTAHGENTAAVDTTAANSLVLSVINASASVSYETKFQGGMIEVVT